VHPDSPVIADGCTKDSPDKKAFSVVASLVRIHLISMLDVFEMLRSTRREYGNKPLGPPGFDQQMKLSFF